MLLYCGACCCALLQRPTAPRKQAPSSQTAGACSDHTGVSALSSARKRLTLVPPAGSGPGCLWRTPAAAWRPCPSPCSTRWTRSLRLPLSTSPPMCWTATRWCRRSGTGRRRRAGWAGAWGCEGCEGWGRGPGSVLLSLHVRTSLGLPPPSSPCCTMLSTMVSPPRASLCSLGPSLAEGAHALVCPCRPQVRRRTIKPLRLQPENMGFPGRGDGSWAPALRRYAWCSPSAQPPAAATCCSASTQL